MKLSRLAALALALALPVAAQAASSPGPVTKKVDLKAALHVVDGKEVGPVSGTPFGKGTVTVTVTTDGDQETATYVATFPKGTITGTSAITVQPPDAAGDIAFAGKAKLTKATGAFKGVKVTGGKVTGLTHAGVIRFTLTGTATFPAAKKSKG